MRNSNKKGGEKMTGERKKRKKAVLALTAAAILSVLTVREDTAYGEVDIQTEKEDCAITFTLDVKDLDYDLPVLSQASPDYEKYYQELSKAMEGEDEAIEVKLYRVAEVDISGNFKLLPGYKENPDLGSLEKANDHTTAEEWSGWAAAAAVTAAAEDSDREVSLTRDGTGTVTGTVQGLKTGMYLVDVEQVVTDAYIYSFIPYLVALPGNYYYRGSDDEWIYGDETPIYVGLKPEREDRYGNLIIRKTLYTYHEGLRGASFIFEIHAVKEDRLVYSDVVSLVFDEAGSRSLTVEQIPAEAEVTVTEVYSGSSYQNVGAGVQRTTTKADTGVSVDFANTYDSHLRGGSSVVNHFKYGPQNSIPLFWEKQ